MCSREIREDILKEYYCKILSGCAIIKDNFSIDVISSLSLKMKEKSFAPGEVILEKGVFLQELYIIKSGETEYYFNSKNNKQHICEYENKAIDFRLFISQTASDISIRSKGITVVAYIDYNSFVDALKHSQIDKEKFCLLRDQFKHDQRYQFPCFSCGQYKHVLFGCPKLTYNVNKSIFLQKHIEKIFQERNEEYDRKVKHPASKKINSFIENQKVRLDLKLIRCDLASYFYGTFYPEVDFQGIPYEQQSDKQFFQVMPKIYQEWLTNKEMDDSSEINQMDASNGMGNKLNGSQYNSYYIEQMTSSDSYQSSSDVDQKVSRSTIHNLNNLNNLNNLQTQQNNNNDRVPSIANELAFSSNAAQPNVGVTFVYDGNKNLSRTFSNQEINKSELVIPSEQKIPFSNHNLRKSIQLIPVEESVSPTSQKFMKIDLSSNNLSDQIKLEQIKLQLSLNRKSLPKRGDTPRKKTSGNPSYTVNQPTFEHRQQSRQSLSKMAREQLQPTNESTSLIEVIDMGRESTPSGSGVAAMQQFSNIQLNSFLGLHRVSMVQGQIQEQIQQLHEMLRQQQRQNDRLYSMNSRSIKSRLTSKMQNFDPNQKSKSINTTSKNKSFSNLQTTTEKENSSKHPPQQETYSLFGQCGYEFESVKEYEFYYPKFNYTVVMRAYRHQVQFNKRMRLSVRYSMIKKIKSIKQSVKTTLKPKFSQKNI